ncbi:Transposase [Bifidobacterium breve JCM 7017]|nr:Transposase [Bifidobacterium breve JCM 7017]
MIIDTETKRKLRETNASDLLDALERLDEQTCAPLSHAEVVRLVVDNAHSGHMDAKIQRLVKRAGLRYPPGGPEDHRPGGGTQARPERDRRPRRRELSGTTVERRVPGSHGIGKIPPAMRVGEIRVPGTVPRSLRPNAGPGRAGDGRVEQARRSAQARARIRHLQPVSRSTNGSSDKPDEPFKRFLLELMELRYDTVSHGVRPRSWRPRNGTDSSAATPSPTRFSTASCTTRSGLIQASTT